ncbi:DMT family transporter [Catellatospora sp. KI3]|uniref:EamA family transporter n=1 Tax=Catellatospora sp. KI3 TaxID=3041620 RepID=UPI0024828742|nr:DMT family transporter [Catellatospora sp. KI3]MDI1466401.1 DMT family transporter [Catellatospora sp. KI3]
MIAILLAGTSALVWGTADFCGGKAVQQGAASVRGHSFSVTVVSQLCAIPMIAVFLLLVPGRLGVSALGWGAASGVAGLFGIVLLYQGLASGAMSVVAPITAVTSALVPLAGGLALGERPGAVPLAAAACAVLAIALVSLGPSAGASAVTPRVIGLALSSGAFFGVFFLLLAQAGPSAGMWPLAGARLASIPIGLALLRPMGGTLVLRGRVLALTALAGCLDIAANGLYLLAANAGQLSIVAPIASLYPASTVLLALAVNGERLRAIQVAGLGLSATALILAAV